LTRIVATHTGIDFDAHARAGGSNPAGIPNAIAKLKELVAA